MVVSPCDREKDDKTHFFWVRNQDCRRDVGRNLKFMGPREVKRRLDNDHDK